MVNLRKSVKFQKKIRLTNTHITSGIAIKLAEKNGGYGFQRFKLHLKWTVLTQENQHIKNCGSHL